MSDVQETCRRAAAAAKTLARLPTEVKNAALASMAAALERAEPALVAANRRDVERTQAAGAPSSLVDRLTLTESRVDAMAAALRAIAAQPDPIGEVLEGWRRPNGLLIEKVRVPLGVVAVIYEARPNVTADVAGLCLKAGNACVLRGSSNALETNVAIVRLLREAIASAGVTGDALQLVDDPSRDSGIELMRAKDYVDLLVPRGGPALIRAIEENATVPFIIDGDGNCHLYVDRAADPQMATSILLNAKTQRPSVCNAIETLLVHEELADKWLPGALEALADRGVEVRGDARVRQIFPTAAEATDEDWGREYLDLILAVRVVPSADDAITHINQWGTSNAEGIVTQDISVARKFAAEVDSGSVFINSSTRFSDGGEFGFGAEIGISTQKLHARGPLGLTELTSVKYVVWGEGQVRS
ncbi:MAG TPA: glutamate-5-semialdehyde dehydrogenase [Actinomycetota bacterium]|nr:glutamate-5-semialdehyde dehydrogenase [Actinomycetota bacterium]